MCWLEWHRLASFRCRETVDMCECAQFVLYTVQNTQIIVWAINKGDERTKKQIQCCSSYIGSVYSWTIISLTKKYN